MCKASFPEGPFTDSLGGVLGRCLCVNVGHLVTLDFVVGWRPADGDSIFSSCDGLRRLGGLHCVLLSPDLVRLT